MNARCQKVKHTVSEHFSRAKEIRSFYQNQALISVCFEVTCCLSNWIFKVFGESCQNNRASRSRGGFPVTTCLHHSLKTHTPQRFRPAFFFSCGHALSPRLTFLQVCFCQKMQGQLPIQKTSLWSNQSAQKPRNTPCGARGGSSSCHSSPRCCKCSVKSVSVICQSKTCFVAMSKAKSLWPNQSVQKTRNTLRAVPREAAEVVR